MQVDRDTVIRWAREMGAWTASTSELEKLAGRAYDAALEQADQKCEELAGDWRQHPLCKAMGESCAEAIRSLKEQPEQPEAGHSTARSDEGSTGWQSWEGARSVPDYPDGDVILARAQAPTGGERKDEASGWLPINTAPKDGTVVIVNDTTLGGVSIGKWIELPEWSGWIYDDDLLTDNNPRGPQPTHWQHLPPPPCLASSGDQKQNGPNLAPNLAPAIGESKT